MKALLPALVRCAAIAVALLGMSPAGAERADRDKPVTITADKSFADDKNQVSVFEGNVIIIQGTLRLEADRVELRRDKEAFDHVTATGNPAKFRQKRDASDEYIDGRARRIEYSGRTEIVELIERAQIRRNQDEINAHHITYNARTEVFQAFNQPGKGPSGNAPERVRAVIQPKAKDSGDKAAPAVQLQPSTGISEPSAQ